MLAELLAIWVMLSKFVDFLWKPDVSDMLICHNMSILFLDLPISSMLFSSLVVDVSHFLIQHGPTI